MNSAPEVLARLDGISLAFGKTEVLSDIDLVLRAGEIVTLVGLNGSGKSSLTRVLLGLIAPDKGTVWRKPGLKIGYTPQHVARDVTLPLTVERFLTLAGASSGAVMATLEEVGVAQTLKTQLAQISGGEMNRVLLARALLRDPELLVLDEPMSGVDVAGQAELYALIGAIRRRRGCGILLVSHDLHVVMRQTDHVVCLNHHICCSGTPQSVVRDDAFISLFGTEIAGTLALYHHEHDHRHGPQGAVERQGGSLHASEGGQHGGHRHG
jgi:zinc transport system ATP-binding protein